MLGCYVVGVLFHRVNVNVFLCVLMHAPEHNPLHLETGQTLMQRETIMIVEGV